MSEAHYKWIYTQQSLAGSGTFLFGKECAVVKHPKTPIKKIWFALDSRFCPVHFFKCVRFFKCVHLKKT